MPFWEDDAWIAHRPRIGVGGQLWPEGLVGLEPLIIADATGGPRSGHLRIDYSAECEPAPCRVKLRVSGGRMDRPDSQGRRIDGAWLCDMVKYEAKKCR
jgi:hypothetical protein